MKYSFYLVLVGFASSVQPAVAFVKGIMYYKSLLDLALPLPEKTSTSIRTHNTNRFHCRGTILCTKSNDIDDPDEPQHHEQNNNYYFDDECIDLCDFDEQSGLDERNLSEMKNRDKEQEVRKNEKSLEHVYKTLELHWEIEEAKDNCDLEDITSCSEPCDLCRGTGVIPCHFCEGTGYINFGEQSPGTVGERLVEKNGGHPGAECPVCNEDGEISCPKCRGSGWIANWRLENETGLRP